MIILKRELARMRKEEFMEMVCQIIMNNNNFLKQSHN